jgi:hypothetical protein
MAIYGRFGHELTVVRFATLDDVQRLKKRKPDQQDREAIKHGSYVITRLEDGHEDIHHQAYLRVDDGSREIMAALEATAPPGLTICDLSVPEVPDTWGAYDVAMLGLDPKAELDVFTLGAALRARGYTVLRAEQTEGRIVANVAPLAMLRKAVKWPVF